MAGGQADDAVDADFAHALIHGPHHGIEHDQGGDDHRYQKLTGPAYFGGADRAVGHDAVALADEQGQRHPRHKGFHAPNKLRVAGVGGNGDGAQAAVHSADALVGQEEGIDHFEVVEGLDRGGGQGARVLGALAGDEAGVFNRIHGRQALAIEIDDFF